MTTAPTNEMLANRQEQLRIQAVGAAISRKDWPAVEQAYNAIRDEFDGRSRLDAAAPAAGGPPLNDGSKFFSENVDRWGASEWFNRLAVAVRDQDKAVLAGDEVAMEICRNVAASSAMRLVRDYEPQVRAALSPPLQAPAHSDAVREALDAARHALIALRTRLKTEPSVQGRGWVDLGIVLNNAVAKADAALTAPAALPSELKVACAACKKFPGPHCQSPTCAFREYIDTLAVKTILATPPSELPVMSESVVVSGREMVRRAIAINPAVSEADVGQLPIKFPYQRTFDAIAAAVTRHPTSLGISVAAFQKAFNEHNGPLAPAASAQGGGTESEATGKRPIPSVSLSSQGEQQRDTLGVTAGETAPFPSDPPSQEASAPPIAGGR